MRAQRVEHIATSMPQHAHAPGSQPQRTKKHDTFVTVSSESEDWLYLICTAYRSATTKVKDETS